MNAVVEKKTSMTEREMKRLEQQLGRLSEQVCRLTDRLTPVMHSEMPTPKEDPQPMPLLPPLVKQISDRAESVEKITAVIESVLNRLEV